MALSSPTRSWSRLLLMVLLVCCQPAFADNPPLGKYYGARSAEKPEWFKHSFLEFEDDVAEAAAAGRRVMLYFHQDGCPYCARLVEENFADPELQSYIVENFDGISLNLWGDREVVSVSGRDFTEKTFAAALKVQYTPTLVFLDERGRTASLMVDLTASLLGRRVFDRPTQSYQAHAGEFGDAP